MDGGDRHSPPLPGGEFLLQLLRRQPPRQHQPPTTPPLSLPRDPAVAALGSAVPHRPIQPNGHDLTPAPRPPFAPHAYIRGYTSNPNSNIQSSSQINYSVTDRNTLSSRDSGDKINGVLDLNKTREGNWQLNPNSTRVQSSSPPLHDSFQNLALHQSNYSGPRDPGDTIDGLSNGSKTREGNWQFNRFADHFYNSPNNSRNPIGDTREGDRQLNGYGADFQDSPNSSSEGSYRLLNKYGANYRSSPNSSGIGEGSNSTLKGFGASYRSSPNSSGTGEGYNRTLNGFEANYRMSLNSNRTSEGFNRALNGFEADNQNSTKSSRICEGYDKMVNGFDSDFPNFPNYSGNQGAISRASIGRQEVKQLPPGFPKNMTNMKFGHTLNNSNGSRNQGVQYEYEREKVFMPENGRNRGGVIGERRVSTQLDLPSPPTGSSLHSVSGSEIEESLSELQSEIDENIGGRSMNQGDLDDLDEDILGYLEKENGSCDKNQKKKRDKDYRSDTRGQRVLVQWMRKSKRMIECRRDIDMLNSPLLAIYDSLVPSEEEKMKQKQLLALLEKLVINEWPEARLLVYGSCANSFGVKKSDIDICLAMKDADVNKSEILLKLADILKAENFENVQALTHARVPIVKLMDPVTGISCDICINNVLAVVNSKLLRDYAKIDGRLRQLAIIVKHWAKLRGVNETYHGTLSSYAYVLMCIHFLQQCRPAVLPCLQGMSITYNVIIDNVECAFFDQVEKLSGFGLRNRESIGELVWGFFRYWAYCHDYAHDVVSVRLGSTISKRGKDWTRRVGNDRHLICIEDPFEVTHDLGRVVDKFSIKVLREEFERAAQILQFDPNPCVTLFEPYVPT